MKLYALLISGPFSTSEVGARKLYAAIYQSLSLTAEDVEVDFTGVTGINTDFLRVAFSNLFEHFSKQALEARLKVSQLDEVTAGLLQVIMGHSDQYINNETYRKIFDTIHQAPPQTPPTDESPVQTGPPNRPPKSPHSQVATKAIEV